MSLASWIARKRWAANMARAKAFRDTLSFSQRQVFDMSLRPRLPEQYPDERTMVIDYPDALYHVTIDDLCRAIRAVTRNRILQ
jgi:hypothetical protein